MSVTIQRNKTTWQLRAEQWLPAPIGEVFDFFSDAMNLESITPPWLNLHVLTPRPLRIKAGTLIDYKLRLRFWPVQWRTLITEWEPPHRFVDEQLRGPYRLWKHVHTFTPVDNGTLVIDTVDYIVPGGELVHRLMVKRDVKAIFDYRAAVMARRFGGVDASHQPVAHSR